MAKTKPRTPARPTAPGAIEIKSAASLNDTLTASFDGVADGVTSTMAVEVRTWPSLAVEVTTDSTLLSSLSLASELKLLPVARAFPRVEAGVIDGDELKVDDSSSPGS